MGDFISIIVVGVILFYVILISMAFKIDSKNKERFDNTVENLKRNGYKIKYYNRTTGTISYIEKDGRYRSISVFRGYNSHYKG